MGSCGFLFTYQSVRYVTVEAKLPALVFRFLQVLVLLYVVLYSVVIKQTYQQYDAVVAETFLKMKGSATLNSSVFDANDLVVPALLENAVFVTTNYITNTEVRNSRCASAIQCSSDTPCGSGSAVPDANHGILTGVCLSRGLCEVKGWCANVNETTMEGSVPYDPLPNQTGNVMAGIDNWSLFVRVNSEFPTFDVKLNSAERGIIPLKNLWHVREILERAGTEYSQVSATGAIISMRADYDCNFNTDSECHPEWTYGRLDKTAPDSNFSIGFNFYTVQYRDPDHRVVTKRYGIKLEVEVSGRGGKFSIVSLLISVGAGISLLGIASLVTDFVLQKFNWKGRDAYHRTQFEELDEDDFQTDLNDEDPLKDLAVSGGSGRGKSDNDRKYHNLERDGAAHLRG